MAVDLPQTDKAILRDVVRAQMTESVKVNSLLGSGLLLRSWSSSRFS